MKIINPILKSTLLLIVIGFNTINAMAQHSRNETVKNFNSVSVGSGIDLYLTQSNTETLTIKGDEDVIKGVVISQVGAHVTIKYKEGVNWGRLFANKSIKVYLSYKNITNLSASGGADVFTQNTLKASAITLKASGGADLKLSISCKELTLAVSGGSDANLKGDVESMKLTASGGSDIDAFSLLAQYAKVDVSGGSDANINVNKALEAGATGGSDVHYKGNAVLKKTSSSKSGDINHVK